MEGLGKKTKQQQQKREQWRAREREMRGGSAIAHTCSRHEPLSAEHNEGKSVVQM